MKKSWNALLVLLFCLPAFGQETPPADPPADAPPADAAPADSGAPADTPAVIESISNDAAASEAPPAEPEQVATIPVDESATPGAPWRLYGGVDWVSATVSASRLSGFATNDYDSGLYRLRFGIKPFDNIAFEGNFGINRSASDPVSADYDNYYGVFAVPNATLFEVVNLEFPVGYAVSKVSTGRASADLNSLAYGVNAELPLRAFTPDLPDLRFELGWMIYYQKVDARIYGLNAGVRYDFDIAGGSSAPSSGPGFMEKVGGFFKGLWPFGGDEEKPAQ